MIRFVKPSGVLGDCQVEFKRKGFIWRIHDLWKYGHVTHICMMSSHFHVIPHICSCTTACLTIDTTVKEKK